MQKLHVRAIQPSVTDNQMLVTIGGVVKWVSVEPAEEPGAFTILLDDLSDVDAPSPADGQVLGWDAAAERWVSLTVSTVASIDDLTDVDTTTTTPAVGDALVWDGANWVPGNAAATGMQHVVSTVVDGEPNLVWVAVGDSFELLYAEV